MTAIDAGIPLSHELPHAGGTDDGATPAIAPPFTAAQPHYTNAGASRVLRVAVVMTVLISLALLGLMVRVAQLQLRTPEPIARLVQSQHSSVPILGRRGTLLDRTGRQLAVTGVDHNLWVDPEMVRDPNFPERVGDAFGLDAAWIARTMTEHPDRRYIVLSRSMPDGAVDNLTELRRDGGKDYRGLGSDIRLIRDYPQAAVGGQLIGFVGFEGKGLEGVEKLFDRDLTGTPGKMTFMRDAAHRPLWIDREGYKPPTDGKNVRLSIDATIQAIAEKELDTACEYYSAQEGQVVVMNPRTGEVLAMANYPNFNPREAGKSKPEDRRNRCITDFFEPGSIFKPFIWSLATEQKFARPDETIDCTSGLYITQAGRKLHDAHGSGMQTWEGVLIKSSNIGMGKVGERMGNAKLYQAVKAYGFGDVPGSGLQGESAGMVNRFGRWTSYTTTSIPMGQEIGVTPLQMTRGFCAFANGGFLIKPTLRAVPAGTLPSDVVVRRVITPAIAAETRSVLRRVVTEGTGKKADSTLYTVFGKTGTAQIAGKGGAYQPEQFVSSFIAGAPLDSPEIVVGCFIHRPDHSKGHYGGIVSAPAVRNVIEQVLPYLGIPPDQTQSGAAAAVANVDARE